MLNNKWLRIGLFLVIAVAVFLVFSQFFTGVFSDLMATIIGGIVAAIGLFFDRFRKRSGN